MPYASTIKPILIIALVLSATFLSSCGLPAMVLDKAGVPKPTGKGTVAKSWTINKKCEAILHWLSRFEKEYPDIDLTRPFYGHELAIANLFRDSEFVPVFGLAYDTSNAKELHQIASKFIGGCHGWGPYRTRDYVDKFHPLKPFFDGTFVPSHGNCVYQTYASAANAHLEWLHKALPEIEHVPLTRQGFDILEKEYLTPAKEKVSGLWPSERDHFYTVLTARLTPIAKKGVALAQYRLGEMYVEGRGVEKNDEEAVKWYRKAAEQGIADAQHKIGLMYHRGNGVRRDYHAGTQWIERAAVQGNADAQNYLGTVYQDGKGVPVDHQKAALLYGLAAEQGHGLAQLNMGRLFYHGDRLPQDLSQAAYWFARALHSGDAVVVKESRRWRAKLERLVRQRKTSAFLKGLISAAVALAVLGGGGGDAHDPGSSPFKPYDPMAYCSDPLVAAANPFC